MTKEHVYDPQLALRQTIAGILDKPSVYMGGPSRQNLKRADEIIAAIRGDARLMQAIGAAEPEAPQICHWRRCTKPMAPGDSYLCAEHRALFGPALNRSGSQS